MDSLARKRMLQVLSLVGAAGLLAGLVAFNVTRPSAEEKLVSTVSAEIMDVDWESTTPEERRAYRRRWEELSPETREKVWMEVSRRRLQQMREKTRDMPAEERVRRIQKRVRRLRERHRHLTAAEREEVRRRLESDEGREMLKKMLNFYHKELTARERAELDPLLHEWMYEITDLTRTR